MLFARPILGLESVLRPMVSETGSGDRFESMLLGRKYLGALTSLTSSNEECMLTDRHLLQSSPMTS